ncbi:MAG: hypothetical protein ACI4WX_12860 [Aristaeellaceae bacterium]
MAEETGKDLVRLGHLILDGTPAEDVDPAELIPYGQVDVTVCDNCRVCKKAVVA